MDELVSAIRDLAGVLNTGSAPGKPDQPFIIRTITGTITAVSTASCTVAFPGKTMSNIRYLLTGRTLTVGDVVLVLQMEHQRFVLGSISH